ncbi:MAG: hypothetical protein IJR90_08915 [Clostridia bacterium]|nr:hypothetical protein [Clostridia bacterium]
MDIPVYMFTGFLESGKTKFLQETLCDPKFFDREGERTLVLMCEEGEVELDPSGFASEEVYIETVDEPRRVNPDKLEALRAKHRATRVLIEYNGMWLINDLFEALPDGWFVYQEMMLADASNIEIYNANMRNLVVDKLQSCDLVVFNRCEDDTDFDALHKLVRGISRRTDIIYEKVNGEAAYDDIEDPLPFDTNAPTVEIGDRDYAFFYRDLGDNMPDYDKKTVRFLGQVSKKGRLPGDGFIIGRPVMTCCVEDIAFSGLFCENGGSRVKDGDWVRLTAQIAVKGCEVYGRKGPVLSFKDVSPDAEPEDPVAVFY